MGSLCAMSLIMFYVGLIIFPLIACFYYILNAFATGFKNFNTKWIHVLSYTCLIYYLIFHKQSTNNLSIIYLSNVLNKSCE